MDQVKDAAPVSSAAEGQCFSVDKIAEVFGVPRHLLMEPGHVMTSEKWERIKAEMIGKQK